MGRRKLHNIFNVQDMWIKYNFKLAASDFLKYHYNNEDISR